MSPVHERPVGATVEWYTPDSLFVGLGFDINGETFDLDPACAHSSLCSVPAERWVSVNGASEPWSGHVWLNPPYGPAGVAFIDRMVEHGDGMLLLPSRTETAVYQRALRASDAVLFLRDRLWFVRGDGYTGRSSFGSTLLAYGSWAHELVQRHASRLGTLMVLGGRTMSAETALREALEAEWYNGNMTEGAYDRILAALAARPDVGSGPFDHEPPDLGTHCAGCAARPVSPPLDVAARAYREAHDLLAVTHTSAQRTVVIERLNDLAKAALAARDEHLAALTRRREGS